MVLEDETFRVVNRVIVCIVSPRNRAAQKKNKWSERELDLKGTKGEGPASVVLRRERPVP